MNIRLRALLLKIVILSSRDIISHNEVALQHMIWYARYLFKFWYKVLWDNKKWLKYWTDGHFGHWTLKFSCFVLLGHYGCPRGFKLKSFFCGRFFETRVYETCLLDQIHVSDVPSWVWCYVYYAFHHTPVSVPGGQIDRYQNVTIKVHWEINLAEPCSSKMFICMKNGKQKTQLGSVSVLNLIVASIFWKKSRLNLSYLEKRYQSTILRFLSTFQTCNLKLMYDPGTRWLT